MAAVSGPAGVRPEDISELVRDLVRRHSRVPHNQAARSEGQVQSDLVSVPEHGAAESSHHHDHYHGQPAHHHGGPEVGAYPAQGRGSLQEAGVPLPNNMRYGMHSGIQRDYNMIREPLFPPHGAMHTGTPQVQQHHMPHRVPHHGAHPAHGLDRALHTSHLGHYGPSQYLDQAMLEEYSRKMEMLQHDFDVMLRPKLDALRRQVVTVEERICEISLTKEELVEEAVLDHRALLEQINISSDRRLSALTLDLEQLMRDVALIHDLIQQLAPAQQGPQTPTAVWALLSRYDELSNACHQLASKRFKTSVEESAGSLRQEVSSIKWPSTNSALLPKGAPHVRDTSAGRWGENSGSAGSVAAGTQMEEMKALLQVKDKMVWMMLEEGKKAHEEKRRVEEEVEALQRQLQDKDRQLQRLDRELEAAKKGHVEEIEKWNQLAEDLKARLPTRSSE